MIRGAVRNIAGSRSSNTFMRSASAARLALRGDGCSTACKRMGSRRELHSHLLQQCQRATPSRGSSRRVVDTCIPRHQLLLQQQQVKQHQRRSFFQDSADITAQTYYTPAEEFMLDATAWFVAGAICLSPAHGFDDLDYQNMEDMQDEAQRREQRDKEKSSTQNSTKNNKKRGDEDGKKGGHHHH